MSAYQPPIDLSRLDLSAARGRRAVQDTVECIFALLGASTFHAQQVDARSFAVHMRNVFAGLEGQQGLAGDAALRGDYSVDVYPGDVSPFEPPSGPQFPWGGLYVRRGRKLVFRCDDQAGGGSYLEWHVGHKCNGTATTGTLLIKGYGATTGSTGALTPKGSLELEEDGTVRLFDADGVEQIVLDADTPQITVGGAVVGGSGGQTGSTLPGGNGSEGDYTPADGATLSGGIHNFDDFTPAANATINGEAGAFNYVQVAGNATFDNNTINLDGRGNEGGNGGSGSAGVIAGNSSAGTAGSAGTSTKACAAGGGGGGASSGGSGTATSGSTGAGGAGGAGGSRGAPWSSTGGGTAGTGGVGAASGGGGGNAGGVGGAATAVNKTLLARRVSHEFLVALLGGAGGGGGGGGSGVADDSMLSGEAGKAGATTYLDDDGNGAHGTSATNSATVAVGGAGGGKGGRGGGMLIQVVRGNVSGTLTVNANGGNGGNGGAGADSDGTSSSGEGGGGGGGAGGFFLLVFYGTYSATITVGVGGGTGGSGGVTGGGADGGNGAAGEDGFYAVVNGSTGEVVEWGGSLAAVQERLSYLVGLNASISSSPADPIAMTAPETVQPVDPTGGALNFEVPEGANLVDGDELLVKNDSASANVITINMSGSDTVDGGASTSIAAARGSKRLKFVGGTSWLVV